MMSSLRVLLISPLRGVDPTSGDVTYTESLLDRPPEDVRYTTYVDALKDGSLVEHGRRNSFRDNGAMFSRVLEAGLLTARQVERAMRRSGIAFREPFRFFSVTSGAFDLVHAHVFSIRLLANSTPLLVSSAGPLRLLYRDARGWSPVRLLVAEGFDLLWGRALGVNVFSSAVPQAQRVIAFSGAGHDSSIADRVTPDLVDIVPNFIDAPRSRVARTLPPSSIGFVATDFDTKGGNEVLSAFGLIRRAAPSARLTIVGSPPRLSPTELDRRGVRWLNRVDRRVLLEEILPTFDLFLYPTHYDGVPFVILEALAFGIPVVTTDCGALPEVVGQDAGLIVARDPAALAGAALRLLDPEANAAASCAAKQRFHERFSGDAVRPKLLASYLRAIEAGSSVR